MKRKNHESDIINLAKVIKQRLGDYDSHDLRADREELVRRWKEAHPDATNEAPSYLKPLIKRTEYNRLNLEDPDEIYFNDTYNVTVRYYNDDKVFGTGKMIQLGINSHDGTARHDWRDFQAIKNQLAGETCEAFELYPSEDRLLDPSNYYTLWCFPNLKQIRVGLNLRRVYNSHESLAPQRSFIE